MLYPVPVGSGCPQKSCVPMEHPLIPLQTLAPAPLAGEPGNSSEGGCRPPHGVVVRAAQHRVRIVAVESWFAPAWYALKLL